MTDPYDCREYPLERALVPLHLDRLAPAGERPRKNILLMHGVTYSSHVFDIDCKDYSLARCLARAGYAVWRLDIGGYGRSGAIRDGFLPDSRYAAGDIRDAVELILRESGEETLDLLGWSWGSVTASRYAALYPGRLRRMVLVAPILTGIGEAAVTEPFHHNTWEHAAEDFQKRPDGSFDPGTAEQTVIACFCSSCWHYDGEQSPNAGRREICVGRDRELIELERIGVPTLIVCGDRDPYVNYDRISAAPGRLPAGSALRVIPGAGHILMLEAPYYRAFQDTVLDFLNR